MIFSSALQLGYSKKLGMIGLIVLMLFLLKPNFNTLSPAITRAGDFVFILSASFLFIFKKKSIEIPKITLLFILGLIFVLSLSFSLTLLFKSGDVFNFKDINEIARGPMFILLPFLFGYNICFFSFLNKTIIVSLVVNCNFLIVAVVMLLQVGLGGNNIFIQMYSQAGLFQGRATGVALFIQEAGLVLLLFTTLFIYFKPTWRYLIIVVPLGLGLLTASKSVFLMLLIYFVCFVLVNEKIGIFNVKFIVLCLLLTFFSLFLVEYLAGINEQFRVSIYEALQQAFSGDFSDRSFSARLESFSLLSESIVSEPYLLLSGSVPLTTHDTIRFEMSFFNLFAKYGLLGTLLLYLAFAYPLFVKIGSVKNSLFYLHSSLIAVSISIILTSFTGATLEGVKGSFFYFSILGVFVKLYKLNMADDGLKAHV